MMLSLFLIASVLLSFTNRQIRNLKQTRNNCSSLFLFISLTKIKRSREGHLETNRKEKSSYYWAWDLETHHSYQLLASLKTVQYRSLWPTNMKYLLRFCIWKHLQKRWECAGVFDLEVLDSNRLESRSPERSDVGLHPYYFCYALHRRAVASWCEEFANDPSLRGH